MSKYRVEGDLDFYAELKKEDSQVDSHLCLISNTALGEYSVKMECGHSFNYEPLYNDLVNHKKKFNSMERQLLRTKELRCPYCRGIQRSLIPFYEELGLPKVHGVNFFDETLLLPRSVEKTSQSFIGVCAYSMTSNTQCLSTWVSVVESLGKTYCGYHKYIAIQEQNKEQKKMAKVAAKQEAANKKEADKAVAQAAKAASKAAKAAEKAAAKAASKAATKAAAKTVIYLCKTLIKSGKNAGKECGCKIFAQDKCKRHQEKISV